MTRETFKQTRARPDRCLGISRQSARKSDAGERGKRPVKCTFKWDDCFDRQRRKHTPKKFSAFLERLTNCSPLSRRL